MIKRNLKKSIAVSLSVIMAVMAMTGCGDTKPSSGTESSSTATESEATTETTSEPEVVEVIDPLGKYEEEITLTAAWVHEGQVKFYPGYEGHESIENNLWLDAYKEYLNINIEYDWTSATHDDHNTKFNLAMAQNKLPDFAYVSAGTYQELVDADLMMDMTDYFDKYASDEYKARLEADGGITRSFTSKDGRLMGLPVTGTVPERIQIFNIRQDWLDELDLEVPKTIDDVVKVAKAFVDNKMGGENTYGLALSKSCFNVNGGSVLGFLHGYGAYPTVWVEQDGELVYGSVMDENKAGLLKLQEMYADGLLRQDFSVIDSSAVKEDVTSGKVGIIYGSYSGASGVGPSKKEDPNAEWTIVEVPTVDGSKAVSYADASIEKYIFVSKDCEYPEAVVKMMNLQIELLDNEDLEIVAKYSTHPAPDGSGDTSVSSYIATSEFAALPWQNLIRHQEAVAALGSDNPTFTLALSETTYNNLVEYVNNGNVAKYSQWTVFGPESTYSVIEEMWNDGRIMANAYQAPKTETMNNKQATLDEAIQAAMLRVVMGEDISTYEKAVSEWYQNGGQTMTEEANEWYKNK